MSVGGLLNAVMHPLTVASRLHHSGTSQVSQMPRDLWLTFPEHLCEKTDTDLLAAHKAKQTQSRPVGESHVQPLHLFQSATVHSYKLAQKRKNVLTLEKQKNIFALTYMFMHI
jgi:hypothetical protein